MDTEPSGSFLYSLGAHRAVNQNPIQSQSQQPIHLIHLSTLCLFSGLFSAFFLCRSLSRALSYLEEPNHYYYTLEPVGSVSRALFASLPAESAESTESAQKSQCTGSTECSFAFSLVPMMASTFSLFVTMSFW